MIKHSEEFKQEAVRIALTSGLPHGRVASDLGVCKSTLNKWVSHYHPSDLVASPQADLARENERLRLENCMLREERGSAKKGNSALREPKAVRFAFVHSWRHRWQVELICRVLQVSERGYRSWRSRPIGHRERTDVRMLAHIREHYSLSLGSYGRPRMTMELKEARLDVGERRVERHDADQRDHASPHAQAQGDDR